MTEGKASEQGVPNVSRGRGRVLWKRDPIILARMEYVQRRHFEGWPNTRIAAELGVDEGTVRNDVKRLTQQWRERIDEQADDLRARAVRELDELKRAALEQADFDRRMSRAVLLGEPFEETECPGDGTHWLNEARCSVPHPFFLVVQRDEHGKADYRGQPAQALNVARQAVMDAAKVLGIVIDKQETKNSAIEEYLRYMMEFGRGDTGRTV